MTEPDYPKLLTPFEVAQIFNVTVKTVQRWGSSGALNRIELPGGSYRYLESEIRDMLRRGDTRLREALRADEMGPS